MGQVQRGTVHETRAILLSFENMSKMIYPIPTKIWGKSGDQTTEA